MNTPSKSNGNWTWRFEKEMLTEELQDRLLTLTEAYGRSPRGKMQYMNKCLEKVTQDEAVGYLKKLPR